MFAVLDRAGGRFLGRSGLKYWAQFDETELGWVLRRDAWDMGTAASRPRLPLGDAVEAGFAVAATNAQLPCSRRADARVGRIRRV
jgi:hypothetical protein